MPLSQRPLEIDSMTLTDFYLNILEGMGKRTRERKGRIELKCDNNCESYEK
jgi:hypothetical protein